MKIKTKSLIIILITISLMACSNSKNIENGIGDTSSMEYNSNLTETEKESNNTLEISIETIVEKHIPKVLNAQIDKNKMKFIGKWSGNVMPTLIKALEEKGWEKQKQLGARLFFSRNIDGKIIKISVTPSEKGGPEEKNAITIVTFLKSK
ncbi:hypothetical protein [Paramaledivibacter caminithermalis]|uniref:Lipoprotein n=1 Tax=Paramaledivibacter caminithermalis (strain DSM 15212 / CIP 107654 / DViRD3) TaxID=1121301 RepID=A0A1M6NDM5_PARC5|nr:hypothetical protein [Paramaledivibacter caminithermalis]SHJ93790.1 hypothetical protein SAMN02745912_01694 [Paramaledivibacter caminithermalis DSM 15212]